MQETLAWQMIICVALSTEKKADFRSGNGAKLVLETMSE